LTTFLQHRRSTWVKSSPAVSSKYLQPLKTRTREYITDQWQERLDYSDTGQFYRDLHSVVGHKIKRLLRPRHIDVQITRLRFGHVRLGEKLHTIGQRSDPFCAVCHELEDVEHFLIKCPAQQQLQHQLGLRNLYCRENTVASVKSILISEHSGDIIYKCIK